jgi:apolipoprotein N-acyltransferase
VSAADAASRLTEPVGIDGWKPWLAAACGGALHFLGFVGFGIWPLALVCLTPLWFGIEKVGDRIGRAALVGFVFGWVSYAGGYLWLWSILDIFLGGNLALAGLFWFADSTWFAARYAIYGAAYALLRRHGMPFAIAALPTFVIVEWLYPLMFPVHLGHAVSDRLRLLQMADLGGPLLLSGFVCATNAGAFRVVLWWRGGGWPARWWIAVAVAWPLALSYGSLRLAQLDDAIASAPKLRVGIVQGNLGVRDKGSDAARDHARYLEQSGELLASSPDLDLVVWPETVYTRGIRGPLPVSGEMIRGDLRVPLLFGAALVVSDGGRRSTRNAALLIGADGVVRSAYEKNLLIPFTEYVPLSGFFPVLREYLTEPSRFDAATHAGTVALGAVRIATPICYEAVRPEFVRRMVADGDARLIVTLANDAWFGRSQGAALHLAMARLRAIELRRALVRATNSGISAVIDPVGRYQARSDLLTRENLRAEVPLLDAGTPYAHFGHWPGWLAVVVLVLAAGSHVGTPRPARRSAPSACPDRAS